MSGSLFFCNERKIFFGILKTGTKKTKNEVEHMIKNYLLDTNILLQNPQSLFGFEDNNVYLCGTTMQELDGKKTAPGELGYNARECSRKGSRSMCRITGSSAPACI